MSQNDAFPIASNPEDEPLLLLRSGILLAPRRVVRSDAPGLATSTAHTAPMTDSKPTKKLNGIPPGRCIPHTHQERNCYVEPIPTFTGKQCSRLAGIGRAAFAVAASTPSADDKAATVRRAEEVVDLLSTCYIREGWHDSFDKDRAAKFLQDVRLFDISAEDVDHEEKIIVWVRDHGVSLDWLFEGDQRGMICGLAGYKAPRSTEPDPIFAAISAFKPFEVAYQNACHAYQEVENWFKAEYGQRSPDALSKKMREELDKAGLIDLARSRTTTHKQISNCPANVPKRLVAALHRELNTQTAAYNERVKPLELAIDKASDYYDDAVLKTCHYRADDFRWPNRLLEIRPRQQSIEGAHWDVDTSHGWIFRHVKCGGREDRL
jgi:hypothetical protein